MNKTASLEKDISGNKYNHLTALEPTRSENSDKYCWLFICDCGNKKIIRKTKVVNGYTKSCGCLLKEIGKNNVQKYFKTHGKSKTPTYIAWRGIKQRCLDKNIEGYISYGGRGIKVCDRWLNSFENFLEDMGERPSPKHSIDRIDNDGNYEPNNCRWATNKEQSCNRRSSFIINYKGKSQTLMEWSEELEMSYHLLRDRIVRYKWDIEKSFMTKHKKITRIINN